MRRTELTRGINKLAKVHRGRDFAYTHTQTVCDQYICSQQQTLENKRFFLIVLAGNNVNEPPILEAGGYPTGLPLSESTKVGTEVFVLKGHDPEGSPVKYGIQLTDHFVVNPRTGVITLAKPLNREVRKKIYRLV